MRRANDGELLHSSLLISSALGFGSRLSPRSTWGSWRRRDQRDDTNIECVPLSATRCPLGGAGLKRPCPPRLPWPASLFLILDSCRLGAARPGGAVSRGNHSTPGAPARMWCAPHKKRTPRGNAMPLLLVTIDAVSSPYLASWRVPSQRNSRRKCARPSRVYAAHDLMQQPRGRDLTALALFPQTETRSPDQQYRSVRRGPWGLFSGDFCRLFHFEYSYRLWLRTSSTYGSV